MTNVAFVLPFCKHLHTNTKSSAKTELVQYNILKLETDVKDYKS